MSLLVKNRLKFNNAFFMNGDTRQRSQIGTARCASHGAARLAKLAYLGEQHAKGTPS